MGPRQERREGWANVRSLLNFDLLENSRDPLPSGCSRSEAYVKDGHKAKNLTPQSELGVRLRPGSRVSTMMSIPRSPTAVECVKLMIAAQEGMLFKEM